MGRTIFNANVDGEFRLKTQFHTVENKEHLIHGDIILENGTIFIEIFDQFQEHSSLFGSNLSEFKRLYGNTHEGELITLFDLRQINLKYGYPGFPIKRYIVGSVLSGYVENDDADVYDSVKVDFTYLEKWLACSMLKENIESDGDKGRARFPIEVINPNLFSVECCISGQNVTIEPDLSLTCETKSYYEKEFRQNTFLKIIPDEPKNLNWYKKMVSDLQNLFTLLIGQPIMIKRFEIKADNNWGVYFSKQNQIKTREQFFEWDVFINYHDISEKFESVLNNWFEKEKTMKNINNLLVGNFYLNQYQQNIFLNYMQGLEGLHRLAFKGTYMSKSKFKKESKKVREFIKENMDWEDSVIKSVTERISYAYEYSLNDRLQDLINHLNEKSRELIIGTKQEIEEFIKEIKKLRNKLTHPDELDSNESDEENIAIKFYELNQQLKIIFMIFLLKELGVSEDALIKKLENNRHYNHILKKNNEKLDEIFLSLEETLKIKEQIEKFESENEQ
ncbi:HEPN domain-containing protein [Bacillus sp. BR_7a]|uniref:ApeA N-terminal domain 1-containing protein n=1 Tax=Bacillus sp. BR_7a TaxID=3055775 RepID=UPI00365EC68D